MLLSENIRELHFIKVAIKATLVLLFFCGAIYIFFVISLPLPTLRSVHLHHLAWRPIKLTWLYLQNLNQTKICSGWPAIKSTVVIQTRGSAKLQWAFGKKMQLAPLQRCLIPPDRIGHSRNRICAAIRSQFSDSNLGSLRLGCTRCWSAHSAADMLFKSSRPFSIFRSCPQNSWISWCWERYPGKSWIRKDL